MRRKPKGRTRQTPTLVSIWTKCLTLRWNCAAGVCKGQGRAKEGQPLFPRTWNGIARQQHSSESCHDDCRCFCRLHAGCCRSRVEPCSSEGQGPSQNP